MSKAAMRDAVALAYSGRIAEAIEAAVAQAGGEDPFLVSQGLEALTALGQQYGVRTTPAIDGVLDLRAADEQSRRRAIEAATALQSRAIEALVCGLLRQGKASWEAIRYVGELPGTAVSEALAAGWTHVPGKLRDAAILSTTTLPVKDRAENDAWSERVLRHAGDTDEEIRRATFTALWVWRPAEAAPACAAALEDPVTEVRVAAAKALAVIDPELLAERADALEAPELQQEVPFVVRVRRAERRAK